MEEKIKELQEIQTNKQEKKSIWRNNWFKLKKTQPINSKNQIFKIVLTGLLLGLSVVLSLFEIPIPIMGAKVPLRLFDALIMAIAIPIIGIWYTLSIGIIEPWLHFALDSDHPPIQIIFDNIANIILIISFILVFYQLFQLKKHNTNEKINDKTLIIKKILAGLILVPLNAIIATLAFVLTIVVLASNSSLAPDEYIETIAAFYQNAAAIFFSLLAIQIIRFLIIYILFALVQQKLSKLNLYNNK